MSYLRGAKYSAGTERPAPEVQPKCSMAPFRQIEIKKHGRVPNTVRTVTHRESESDTPHVEIVVVETHGGGTIITFL